MKIKISKLLSFVLLIMAVLTITACGSKMDSNTKEEPASEETVSEEISEDKQEEPAAEEPAPEEAEEETLTGTYKGQLDFTSMMTGKFSEYLGVEISDPLYMDVNLELYEDQTFHLYIDIEKFKADIIAVVTSHTDDIIAVFLEKEGLGLDDIEDVAKANGYESADDFKQALIEEMETSMDNAMNLDDYKDGTDIIGTYTFDDKTIILKNDNGNQYKTSINDYRTLNIVIPINDQELTLIMSKQ